MHGGGYYPTMSNTEWRSAPWNQSDDEYETCPDCCGDGGIYYNEDGEDITKNEYLRLSEEEKKLWEFEKCSTCNGSGEVIKEAEERDWDAIYESRHNK